LPGAGTSGELDPTPDRWPLAGWLERHHLNQGVFMRASSVVGSALALFLLCGGLAAAEEPKEGEPKRKVPPPEAVAACSAKKVGAACRFTLKENQVTGACHPGPEGAMACRPNRGTRPSPLAPPPPPGR
jgi:hypothetical protein